ncbi:MAG: DUF3667 domain-containing protein [Saprospiraceae bacterium]|nr:DUF3667 domain-containing protein [Saprospiraceae bacterium]
MPDTQNKNYCLNCEKQFQASEEYCMHCGQHRLSHDLSARVVIRELFHNFFNIDSRFFHTVRNIWRPYFLTRAYIAGKRKSYLLPTQTFLFTLFLAFTLIIFFLPSLNNMTKRSALVRGELAAHESSFDTIAPKYIADTTVIKKLRADLYADVDSMNNFLPTLFSFAEKHNITLSDVYNKSVDSIIIEKKLDKWYQKLILRQSVNMLYNPIGSTKFLIGNTSWVFVLTVLLTAIFAKLVYMRGGFYLLEHLTFNMYMHSTIFLLISIGILINNLLEGVADVDTFNAVLGFMGLALIIWNIHKYYQGGKFRSFVKMSLMFTFYILTFSFCLLLVLGISLVFI